MTIAGAKQPQKPLALDLALIIDATGSMGDEIAYLKAEIQYIVKTAAENAKVSMRFAMVFYRDTSDTYVTRMYDFTSDLNAFEAALKTQFAGGGGDYEEAVHDGLKKMNALSWRTESSVAKIAFLIADAPPHNQDFKAYFEQVDTARRKGIRMFPIGASGVQDVAEYVFRVAAISTMGRYVFLTNHSGIGNPHKEADVPCYKVQRLSSIMAGIIASELDGSYEPVFCEESPL